MGWRVEISTGCSFLLVKFPKNVLTQTEIDLYIVVKFQVDRARFQEGEARANFGRTERNTEVCVRYKCLKMFFNFHKHSSASDMFIQIDKGLPRSVANVCHNAQ